MNNQIEQNEWTRINLSQKEIQQENIENKSGARIRFFASPSDIPKKMRTNQDEDNVEIEFKYLSSEEPTKQVEENGLSLMVGKKSGKIYKVIIPKSSIEDDVPFELNIAFEVAENSVESLQSSDNGFRSGNLTAVVSSLKSLLVPRNNGFARA